MIKTVLDLYCGIGTISLLLAQSAGKVIGIENVEAAVSDARAMQKEIIFIMLSFM